ncbi:MAG: RluA family pseudouridine synthase [Planctomycetota bacterium]
MSELPPRCPTPTILHADEELLVVDKPAGVLSVLGHAREANLPELLRARRRVPPDEPFRTVHRLDRDASGVMVFARTLRAQRRLTEQFAGRRVEELYLALVQGHIASDGEVDLPLSVDRSGTRTEVAPRGGKPSLTRYRVVERLADHTLLECRPLTGRLHQVRVHLAAIGHPLAVDPLYGGGRAVFLSAYKPDYQPSHRHAERPLIDRLTLHAARLTFEHPAGGGPVTFEAPLPKDFRATLYQLRRV